MMQNESAQPLRVYTTDEIAEILKTTPRSVQGYIKRGKLKAHKIGRSWKILEEDLKAFIESN